MVFYNKCNGMSNRGILNAMGRKKYFLDFFPGATVAYSLRRLSKYATYCVKVRRSSDDALLDIGFKSGVIDTDALLDFCGDGNGFVHTWYDQSFNNNHISQSDNTKQPKIVNSGTLIQRNNLPVVSTDGSNDYFKLSLSINSPYTFFIAHYVDNTKYNPSDRSFSISCTNSSGTDAVDVVLYQNVNGSFYRTYLWSGKAIGDNTQRTGLNLASVLFNNTSSSIYVNGSNVANGDTGSYNIKNFVLGANWALNTFVGIDYYELIIYPNNNFSSRVGIESNINDYYSIY